METQVDVEQAGQQAFHVQLRSHSRLDQGLKFRWLERSSGAPLALELALVKLKDHR
jgi:hypothetical protein